MGGSFSRGLGHRGLVLAVLLVVVVVAAPASAAPPPAINQFQFSPNLQFGGRSPAVAIDPFDNTIAIAGSESGGLDRTTDGGQTWSHLSFPQFVIGDVRYDPQDATRVVATSSYDGRSTPQSGIWRSTDGGLTFARANVTYACTSTPSAYGISWADGADVHQKVFVANDCGVAYSNDGGATWSNVSPAGGGAGFRNVMTRRVGVDSALAYACGSSGIFSTTVTGTAAPVWTAVSYPSGYFAFTSASCDMDFAPGSTSTIFLTQRNCQQDGFGNCNAGSPFGYRIWESDNGGTSWTELTAANGSGVFANNRDGFVVTRSPLDGAANAYDLYWGDGFGVYRQRCSTLSTPNCSFAAETGSQCTNAIDDDGDGVVNEGCPAVGPDTDGDGNPDPENEGATPGQCKNATDDDSDGTVNDGCSQIEFFTNGTHVDVADLAFDPTSLSTCPLLTANDGGIGRSTDCGATWTDSNPGRFDLQVYNVFGTVRGSGATQGDIYFGTQDNNWWASLDNGATWTQGPCCEGFLGQVDHRVPSGGDSAIQIAFVNCSSCRNEIAGRNFAGRALFPGVPGNDGNPIRFGEQRYVAIGSNLANSKTFQLYVMRPETGTQCNNAIDDDLDTGYFATPGAGAVNDGCPADGAPESGTQCHNATDDDGDGKVNDGCSHIFSAETGSECTNSVDDDRDGVANDGCPANGQAESGVQCLNTSDDDGDGSTNDGCPEVGVWGPMGPTFTQQWANPILAAGPATGPTFYFGVNTGGNVWKLRKIAGPMSPSAIMSDASGSGGQTLNDIGVSGFQFYFPLVIGIDPNNPLHLIAADDGTDQMKESVDGGNTWQVDAQLTSLVTNNGEFRFDDNDNSGRIEPRAINWDPENANRILVGTELSGVLASVDGGVNWFRIRGSLNTTPFVDGFHFDEDHNVTWVSTIGRGLWKLTLPQADLSVTKTASPDPATAGEQLFYTITVKNNGPDDATGEVVDTLPPEVTFLDDNLAPPLGCTEGPVGTVRCDVGVIANGASKTFQIKVLVKPDAIATTGPRAIFNTVQVRPTDAEDSNPANDTAVAPTFVDDRADLSVQKFSKPDSVANAGQTVQYTIYVDNAGPSYARDVTVNDTFLTSATGLTFGTPTTTQGTCTPVVSNAFSCNLGAVADHSRVTITVTAAATGAGDLNNTVRVSSPTPDPNPANNTASTSLTIRAVSDLSLTKTAAPSPVIAGTNITWTLTLSNAGPSAATNVVVSDDVPNGVVVQSVTGTGGASCVSGQPGNPALPARCSFGSVASGGSRTMTIVATVKSGTKGVLENDARVSSDAVDPNNANDSATTFTNVTQSANLALTFTADSSTAKPSTTIHYKVTVDNLGPSDADGVVVTVHLPPAKSGYYVKDDGGCTLSNVTLTCPLGTFVAGAPTRTILIDWFVQGSKFPIVASASVASPTPDPVTSNNSASFSVGKQ